MIDSMSISSPANQELAQPTTSVHPEQNSNKSIPQAVQTKLPLLVGGVVLTTAVVVGVIGVSIGQGKLLFPKWFQTQTALPQTSTSEDKGSLTSETEFLATPSSAVVEQASLTGKLALLTQNLSLFKYTEAERQNGVIDDFTYYQAGTYTAGEYAGYTRVIAIRPPEGPSDPQMAILATKDFQSYVLDDTMGLTTKYSQDNWQNPLSYLDTKKISKVVVLPSEFLPVLSLNDQFALFFRGIPTRYQETDQVDANGNRMSKLVIALPETKAQLLSSSFPRLKLFSHPYTQDLSYLNQLDAKQQTDLQLRAQYFAGFSTVTAVDSVGLPVVYAQTTPANIVNYTKAQKQYEQDYQRFEQELARYNQDQSLPYPDFPQYVAEPSLGFTANQVKLQDSSNQGVLFTEYQTAIPGACAMNQDTRIFTLKDDELQPTGMLGAIQLYTLKDQNHPLYQLAYANKMEYFEQYPDDWEMVNKGTPRYSFVEYKAKQPLLFFKDYWQRWVGVGEFDVNLPGGCGKPVIYLYPSQPTSISVRLDVPVNFTTQIPAYQGGWQVMAQPNGTLSDLKQSSLDCDQYDLTHFGAEYAREACVKNQYPYLYWAGTVRAEDMPKPSGGWVVAHDRLAEFLTSKLTAMGLNAIEQRDFLDYWVPTIQRNQAPWYLIGFLQTRELGMLFPMTVVPQPDSVFRIFLDYTPLQSQPEVSPLPQQLQRVERRGFTLVEWGGIKK